MTRERNALLAMQSHSMGIKGLRALAAALLGWTDEYGLTIISRGLGLLAISPPQKPGKKLVQFRLMVTQKALSENRRGLERVIQAAVILDAFSTPEKKEYLRSIRDEPQKKRRETPELALPFDEVVI